MALLFVSHSNKDNNLAADLKLWVNSIGYAEVFLDFDKHSGFGAGTDWERRLYSEIEQCQAVIIVLTPAWLESKWCFAEFTQARALGKPIFPVIMSPIGERFFAGDIQAVDLVKDGEGGREKLSRSLVEVALRAQGGFSWNPERPPYPGLQPFDEEDAAVFFGRDDDVRRVIERLSVRRVQGGPRLLTLLAASGTGKSSFLRAGLLPRLRRDPKNWIILSPIRPGRQPVDELARTLSHSLGGNSDWRDIRDQLNGAARLESLRRIAEDLRTAARSYQAQILIPIDQGEELFKVTPQDEAQRFFEVLSSALARDLPYLAFAVMRSDHLASLQVAPGLGVQFDEISLKPLPLERVGEIIRGPAKVAGIEVEDGLVSAMMRHAATPDALPLIALTLRKLYDNRGTVRVMSLAAYEALGDSAAGSNPLENVVRRAADEALSATHPSSAEIEALRTAFVPAMVRVDDQGEYTRRPASLQEIPPAASRLVDALIAARLLVTMGQGGENKIEVAHEALLRKWPRLRGWLDLERDFIIGKRQLETALREWQATPTTEKESALLHGLLLNRARQWLTNHAYALSGTRRRGGDYVSGALLPGARLPQQSALRFSRRWLDINGGSRKKTALSPITTSASRC